jgi:hypothetical protein
MMCLLGDTTGRSVSHRVQKVPCFARPSLARLNKSLLLDLFYRGSCDEQHEGYRPKTNGWLGYRVKTLAGKTLIMDREGIRKKTSSTERQRRKRSLNRGRQRAKKFDDNRILIH